MKVALTPRSDDQLLNLWIILHRALSSLCMRAVTYSTPSEAHAFLKVLAKSTHTELTLTVLTSRVEKPILFMIKVN